MTQSEKVRFRQKRSNWGGVTFMDVCFNQILGILKKYWTDKDGTAGYDVARKVISLITTEKLHEFKSDTTYKTIFATGPSKRATAKVLNNLAGGSIFADYIEENISEDGRSNLAKDLKKLTGVPMDRGTVGRVCYNLLLDSLKVGNHLKNNKNKKSPLKKSEEEKIDVRSGVHQYISYVRDKEEIEVDGVSFKVSAHLMNDESEVVRTLPYCHALFEAYSEKGDQNITAKNIENSEYKSHFERQKRWFNEAAWYERSLRDTVVDFDDQYDLLKQDVYEGIEPVYHDEDFGTDGIKRLKKVHQQVVILQLDRSNLKNIDNILGNDTKKGLCHVLVNDGEIKSWVKVDYDEVI